MSNKKIIISDKMLETQLIENSNKLNISMDKLIERYIERGLYGDDYYKPPKLTLKELKEINKKELERERKMGLLPVKNDFDCFVNHNEE